jgi:hypothetical protein
MRYMSPFTLWLFTIAMENCPVIDGLPSNSMVIFHGKLLNNQMVMIFVEHTFLSIHRRTGSNFPDPVLNSVGP